MKIKTAWAEEISGIVCEYLETGITERLVAYLTEHSNLPGSRANLELAEAFADVVEERCRESPDACRMLLPLCAGFTVLPPEFAPVGTPEEFLSFCGVLGIAAIGSAADEHLEEAFDYLLEAAEERRWRLREASAMGIQRLIRCRRDATLDELELWVAQGGWLAMRAVAAGVADPPLLRDPDTAEFALKIHRRILVRMLTAEDKRSDEFKTLRKGLGYSLSVVISALPDKGFSYIRQLAEIKDPDIRWIVQENITKSRLQKSFPAEVEAVAKVLG
jgi:hypothetical protein